MSASAARERFYGALSENPHEALILHRYALDERGEVVDLIFEGLNRAAESVARMKRDTLLGTRTVTSPVATSRWTTSTSS
jgi:hypothetical protein